MVKIGWCPYIDEEPRDLWKNLALIPPQHLKEYNQYDKDNSLRQCPAHLNSFNNTFEIQCPIDFSLKWEHGKQPVVDRHSMLQSSFILPREADYTFSDKFMVSLRFQYVFVANKPMMIEVTPAYKTNNNVFRAVTGKFDIHSWMRPLDCSLEFFDRSGEYHFKRGEPLLYVKFYGQDPYESIQLNEIEFTKEIKNEILSCVTLKDHWPRQSLKNLYKIFQSRRKWKY